MGPKSTTPSFRLNPEFPTMGDRSERGRQCPRVVVSAVAAVLLAAAPLWADDEKKEPGLYMTGDLGFLWTSGNSKSNSLGLKLDLARLWTKQAFRFSAGALRQASSPARVAVGTPEDFELEVLDPKATAEEYFARMAYDRQINDRLFYTLGAGWERRPFAGIDNRWMGGAGIGYALAMGEPTDFRAVLGLTYTNEDPIVDDPEVESDFLGLRLSWDLKQVISSNTKLTHGFRFDQNLSEGSDSRIDTDVALVVSINKTLALKAGMRLWFDNQPALEELALIDPAGSPTGFVVPVRLKKVDTQASVALVVNLARKDAAPPPP
jgi:putative salt-induced outer membrane protein